MQQPLQMMAHTFAVSPESLRRVCHVRPHNCLSESRERYHPLRHHSVHFHKIEDASILKSSQLKCTKLKECFELSHCFVSGTLAALISESECDRIYWNGDEEVRWTAILNIEGNIWVLRAQGKRIVP
jgi:hypothetical protein